ncbi:diacylglycerol/lipid kinase family protein [Anaeromicropila populeti]|uniref:Lipid kinase, YegS/Rv2252/BmrU family n=1 Tax=Anaeromicropila populeti TaxID=37658 RepID=A0A1I6L2R1_9FIRM|nr:YegS/Rv2252/BmrU family lipid kinase [Anaeromicropila populeti]SFR97745.1 lipid kinase, YegS/Rv2252/BmrU family [Anaeromicropila populeti]
MKKVLFVMNPKSGKATIKNALFEILDLFTKNNFITTVYATQKSKDAIEIIEKVGEEYELIVCSGGDGTLDEVVTGILNAKLNTPIGYIPAGSTNDFAKSLGIPSRKMEAAKLIVHGKEFQCDIGVFNQSYFVYIAAFGIFTDVSYSTPQSTKNLIGHMAYLLEGVKSLSLLQSYHLIVEHDEEVIEDDFIFGMITNSISVGGFKSFRGQKVQFDDGLFEVLLIRMPKNPLELQSILGALILNDINKDYMCFFKTSELTIHSEQEVSWTLDGEFGGLHKTVLIQNKQKEITILRNMDLHT